MRSIQILATLLVTGCFATGASAFAQAPCNTWQSIPGGPIGVIPVVGLVYGASTQTLYQATDEGVAGHSGTPPWIGRWSGGAWITMPDAPQAGFGTIWGLALCDTGSGPTLYTLGSRTSSGGLTDFWRWDGTSFVSEPNIPGVPTALTVFDYGTGPSLYAASSSGVYRLVAGAWTAIGASALPSTGVGALCVHDDGTGPALYAGGNFTSLDGVAASGIARWNGSAWSALGSGVAGQTAAWNNTAVVKLLSVREEAGPRLYAAGSFQTMNGQASNSIARFDGTSWTGIGGTFPAAFGQVENLTTFDDGTGRGAVLIASGWIATFPGTPAFLKRLDGSEWSDVLSPSSGYSPILGAGLLTADLADTVGDDLLVTVYAPSTFTHKTARIEACDQTGRLYCVGDGATSVCPCGNDSPLSARAGCLHSAGFGGSLRASGRASLAADSLHLVGSTMNDGPVLTFQGSQQVQYPFGDGLVCAGGALVRLRVLFNVGGGSTNPQPGGPLLSTQGFVAAPGTRYYQARFRDSASFCTSATSNYTNGVAVVWSP